MVNFEFIYIMERFIYLLDIKWVVVMLLFERGRCLSLGLLGEFVFVSCCESLGLFNCGDMKI